MEKHKFLGWMSAYLILVMSSAVWGLEIVGYQKISSTEGNFTGILDDGDALGCRGIAYLGDLDGDGTGDIAVGAPNDDDGWTDSGAVWIMFLNPDGTVKNHQKISRKQGNFTGIIRAYSYFGNSVACLGDLDGDGVTDIAVGMVADPDGLHNAGAVWILFLNSDGTVKAHQKINEIEGGFTGTLSDGDKFSYSLDCLGDLDVDGVTDIAVVAPADDDGGENRGAVWILFLNSDGTVKGQQKISDTEGNFVGVLDNNDAFGFSVALLGDLDGDGVCEIAVGAHVDDDGGKSHGAVWILFLNTDGTVKSHQKISDTQGNFTGDLDDYDFFGSSVVSLGDVDGDGVNDLAVGTDGDDDGGHNRGAVWILFLNSDGTVKDHQKISDTEGGFTGIIDTDDKFGCALALVDDLDGNGTVDLIVGARGDDDGGYDRGAVWILFLKGTTVLDVAVGHIEDAMTRKAEALELIDEALASEQAARELLNDLRDSGDSNGLEPGDIVQASQKIHSAMQHEVSSKKSLHRSISQLEVSLAILNGQGHGNGQPNKNDEDYADELINVDVNADTVIDFEDFYILSQHWLESYGTK